MTAAPRDIDAFIETWARAGGGERSNYQLFLTQLCDLIGAPRPEPAVEDESSNAYVFERRVTRRRLDGPATATFIDLYKRGCFILEAKQSAKREKRLAEQLGIDLGPQRVGSGKRGGARWDALMRNAREQAEAYAKRLPVEEGWPPFLVVVDVGHVIELYVDFSLQGKHYRQFPDRQSYRIYLEDLRDETVRERLRLVWSDPHALNPSRRTAQVTREIAELLARLSRSLETRMARALPDDLAARERTDHEHAIAEKVALFLMRCLFTMFAEDVGLLARDSFVGLLKRYEGKANRLHFTLTHLWQDMNRGGFSPALEIDVLHFNGGLFKDSDALELTEDDLALLIHAAQRQWQEVEPAIFGTLLERALDVRERSRLGAHYTPRAYVERLVVATVIEPLTEDWRNVQAAAEQWLKEGAAENARREVRRFHQKLCATTVLDPACGTGNFLYVALELLKLLEGEVLEALKDLGEDQYLLELDRHTVDPHQFLGLEINPRAVAIAELVLWIGYLQWHFRTRGRTAPAEPVLKNFRNIREQDAILAFDKQILMRDDAGKPVTRWDGVTTKVSPVTGEPVPDPDARTEVYSYTNPRPADWPKADFIVGNPPFIGGKDMRRELGDGYAEACWAARPHVPGGADFVMHFWDKAAQTVRLGGTRRFGLITTNSITQKFSRRVIEHHMKGTKKVPPVSLLMAIPDHPWMKSADKAAVRIAMTVGVAGDWEGVLRRVVDERDLNTDAPKVTLSDREGKIWADLTIGADKSTVRPLMANNRLSSPGVKLHGAGFIVTPAQARALGLGTVAGLDAHVLAYRNGRDLTARPRGVMVIDLYPLSEAEVRDRFPAVYQRVLDRVKPERDNNNRATYRDNWWIFGEPRRELRPALAGLARYIATVETSKHRFFQFLDADVRPDNKLVCIASSDGHTLGVLSSRIHVTWALAAKSRLGQGNDPVYVKTFCFDAFSFPDPPEDLKARIRDLGERLDAHRKAVMERHRQLTMTGLYNVLEKVRADAPLSGAEKDVYEAGLVGVLKQIHDDLDAAVAAAYGWPADLPDEEILVRLVALNQERAAEERSGHVRWLRPEFQAPKEAVAAKAEQIEAELGPVEKGGKKPKLPTDLPEQVAAIRAALDGVAEPLTALDLARRFSQGKRVEKQVDAVLKTLTLLGQAERVEAGYTLAR